LAMQRTAVAGTRRVPATLEIEATDREIDRLVYELYGLTEEEIRIVEQGERAEP
jgi:hypothetical protein